MCHSRIFSIVLLIVALVGSSAAASVPRLINYQGTLIDSVGQPLDGPHTITIAILSDSCGGSVLWDETHAGVMVDRGIFNLILGGSDPFPADLFDNDERWMRVTIGGYPSLSPCMRITSVPWAISAAVADSVKDNIGKLKYDSEAQVYTTDAGPTTYTDLDLSATIGASRALVFLKVKNDGSDGLNFTCRTNGETAYVGYPANSYYGGGVSGASIWPGQMAYVMVITDGAGVIEFRSDNSNREFTIYLVAHEKMLP
jgi:hypothetical protein